MGDGFGGASCELAHLGMDACTTLARHLGLSILRLFTDVVQAFPSIVVSLTVPLPERSGDTQKLLEELGFDPEEALDIIFEHSMGSEGGDASEHLKEVAAAYQADQWLACDHSSGVMASSVGTSAGVPLAGIIATAALSRITKRIRCRIRDAGLMHIVDAEEARQTLDPSGSMAWSTEYEMRNFGIVDDDVYIAMVPAEAITDAATKIGTVLFEEYERSGLQLHLDAFKTAAVVSWLGDGKGSSALDLQEAVCLGGGIEFCARGKVLQLPVTNSLQARWMPLTE